MRFILKCVFVLGILYRAILVSQGGPGPVDLATAALASAVPLAQSAVRREIATRAYAYCRSDPAACLADAARLASLVTAGDAGEATVAPRHRRTARALDGALAAQAR